MTPEKILPTVMLIIASGASIVYFYTGHYWNGIYFFGATLTTLAAIHIK